MKSPKRNPWSCQACGGRTVYAMGLNAHLRWHWRAGATEVTVIRGRDGVEYVYGARLGGRP